MLKLGLIEAWAVVVVGFGRGWRTGEMVGVCGLGGRLVEAGSGCGALSGIRARLALLALFMPLSRCYLACCRFVAFAVLPFVCRHCCVYAPVAALFPLLAF